MTLPRLKGPRDMEKAKQALKAAGHQNERVVLMVPTDYATTKAMGDVAADTLQKIGINLEHVSTDWGTLLQRRTNRGPVEQGAWSLFMTSFTGLDWSNPAVHVPLRGNGEAGWAGWATDTEQETLRDRYMFSDSLEEQKKICEAMQLRALQEVPYFPLGQRFQPTAYRADRLSGVNQGIATFWNIKPV